MPKLYVCGEALIDFVPCVATDGTNAFVPKPGGSPYNAACAAALAGADVSFIGGLSSDLFGEQLEAHLLAAGVSCDLALRSDDPTTLAFVDTSGESPRYAFFNNGTATRNMEPDPANIDPDPLDILDVGSISLIDLPGADNIADYCMALAGKLRISLDPNARPSMTTDKANWVERQRKLLSIATIVKLSDEDLDYYTPGVSADAFIADQLGGATELVIFTKGGEGASAYTGSGSATVAPPKIEVQDTVGAGDSLMGAVLAWLLDHCGDDDNPISGLDDFALTDLLRFATTGAAINCTRVGAAPPTKAEILAFL
ncbi:MAG: carbohydrate kinase [Pseudomonadota bacterium]